MKTLPILNAGMGEAVLRHLSQFVDIDALRKSHPASEEIFIAGQAVASAVSELYFGGFGVVYNDVDAFVMSSDFEVEGSQVLSTLEFRAWERQAGAYQHVGAATFGVYSVMTTKRTGMLNEVLCKPQVKFASAPDVCSRLFVASFDLNCVQVGVRLSDGALVWSQDYAEFLRTREMLVVNNRTPVHTAIRWFRKKQELDGVFGHDGHAMELLAASRIRYQDVIQSGTSTYALSTKLECAAGVTFGPQYTEKARDVLSELSPYFSLERATGFRGLRMELHTLAPVGRPPERMLNDEVPWSLMPTYVKALQGHWKRHVCERVVKALELPVHTRFRDNILVEGVHAVTPLTSDRQMEALSKFFDAHQGLTPLWLSFNTAQQLHLMNTLNDLQRERGPWVIGLIEQASEEWYREVMTNPPAPDKLRASLEAATQDAFDRYEKAVKKNPFKGKPFAGDINGYQVRELRTFMELLTEGSRMHHCVGGYAVAVMNRTSRIFSLKMHRVQDSVTVELRADSFGWRNAQVRGIQNRPATDAETRAANKLLTAMNADALLRQFGIQLSADSLIALGCKHSARIDRMVELRRKLTLDHWKRSVPMNLRRSLLVQLAGSRLEKELLKLLTYENLSALSKAAYLKRAVSLLSLRLQTWLGQVDVQAALAPVFPVAAQRCATEPEDIPF